LRKTEPLKDILERAHRVYKIPCECGTDYIDELGRLLGVRLQEHNYNLNEAHFQKSKLALHAFEGGHKFDWTQPSILQFEPNVTDKKSKETARMLRSNNPLIQKELKYDLGCSHVMCHCVFHSYLHQQRMLVDFIFDSFFFVESVSL
jgi:hypothetical protein